MSEGAATVLFYALPLIALSFLPIFVALCWRRERLFATLIANLSVFVLGPVGILLAIALLVAPKEALERVQGRLRTGRIATRPRAWRERECPACRHGWCAR